MSGDGFSEYKNLQKQIDETERRGVSQAIEISRLRVLTQTTRDSLEQLRTAMLGNALLGMQGVVERLESLEAKLIKIWQAFLLALFLFALLNIVTLFLLVRLLDRL